MMAHPCSISIDLRQITITHIMEMRKRRILLLRSKMRSISALRMRSQRLELIIKGSFIEGSIQPCLPTEDPFNTTISN